MKINLRNFPVGGRHYQGEDPVDILDVQDPEYRFGAPISYNLHAVVTGHSLVVTGKLWTRTTVSCVRCLRQKEQEVRVTDFVAHQEITPTQDFADLTENLREDILLALPQNPLCSTECRGLCPVCGQDLNQATCSCAKGLAEAGKEAGGSSGTPWSALDRIKIVRK